MNYLWFLFVYAGPFIALAALYLLFAYAALKLEHRHPPFYRFAQRIHEALPKIGGIIVIVVVVYLFFTQPSYYGPWTP